MLVVLIALAVSAAAVSAAAPFAAAVPAAAPSASAPALVAAPLPAGAGAPQEVGGRPWPEDWFSDLPAVELTGEWVFYPAGSDPMLSMWEGREVTYEISQQAAFIVLDFKVPGAQSNRQRYSWDGTIQRFERGGRLIEEAARWTNAGRTLEVAGRHWDPETPNQRTEYRFTYEVRADELVFVQESDTGRTVWRFRRRDR